MKFTWAADWSHCLHNHQQPLTCLVPLSYPLLSFPFLSSSFLLTLSLTSPFSLTLYLYLVNFVVRIPIENSTLMAPEKDSEDLDNFAFSVSILRYEKLIRFTEITQLYLRWVWELSYQIQYCVILYYYRCVLGFVFVTSLFLVVMSVRGYMILTNTVKINFMW